MKLKSFYLNLFCKLAKLRTYSWGSENIKSVQQFWKRKYPGKIIFHLLLDC